VPQLGILAGVGEEPHDVWWWRGCEGSGWVARRSICATAGVIDEAQDVQGALYTCVWRRKNTPLGR